MHYKLIWLSRESSIDIMNLVYMTSKNGDHFIEVTCLFGELGSSVRMVSGYELDNRTIEVRFPVHVKGFFLQPLGLDRLWGPSSLL
jgi:hypothetical protein